MKSYCCLTAAIAVYSLAASTSWAEKVDMTNDELTKAATHVVVGKVKEIYFSTTAEGDWIYTNYLAEISPQKHEKGEDLKDRSLIYVRYWTRRWVGKGRMPTSTSGHRGLPSRGEVVRLFLRNDGDDGGLNVIHANGFEVMEEAKSGKSRVQTER